MSSAVGVDPIDPMFIVENHDEALDRWRRAGARDRLLVHVDAHHDAVRRSSYDPITISNYVRAAVEEGLVREAFWAVPEPSWQQPAVRRAITEHVAALDMPMRACPVSELPPLAEPVLLDIDVDYFVTPEVRFGAPDVLSPQPWCWPADLVAALRQREVRTDLLTIAYSVEGGHTPLQWKYLGDALAAILHQPATKPTTDPTPGSAAHYYHLAQTHLNAGRLSEARTSLQEAYTRDPSYRTPYASGGLVLLHRRDWCGARAAFERALTLDPDDAFALAGLGRVDARMKRWEDAARNLARSLSLNARQLETAQSLGDVLFAQHRWADAEQAYMRAMSLALAGERSLDTPISSTTDCGPGDPNHAHVHAQLARLAARRGDLAGAVAGLKISLATGPSPIATRLRLAWLQCRLLAGW